MDGGPAPAVVLATLQVIAGELVLSPIDENGVRGVLVEMDFGDFLLEAALEGFAFHIKYPFGQRDDVIGNEAFDGVGVKFPFLDRLVHEAKTKGVSGVNVAFSGQISHGLTLGLFLIATENVIFHALRLFGVEIGCTIECLRRHTHIDVR